MITSQKVRNNIRIGSNLIIGLPRLITTILLIITGKEDSSSTMFRGIRVMTTTGSLRWARTC